MNYGTLTLTHDGPVATITLNRPDRLNAYTPEMGEDLVEAFRTTAEDETVRAVIVTGAGRGYCAGADLSCFKGELGPSGLTIGEEAFVQSFAPELRAHPKLVIAAINGPAAGIGVTMSLCMDIRLMAAGAKLKLNFADMGIVPGLGATFTFPRLIGLGATKKLLLCDREATADEAAQAGLVEEVCAPGDLLPRARELALKAAELKPAAVDIFKQAIHFGAGADFTEAFTNEAAQSAVLRRHMKGD